MKRDAINFGSDRIPGLFRKIFIPTLIGMVSMALMTTIDGVFVGLGVGSDALAAVNIFVPFWMMVTGLGQMFGIGCSVVASIHLSKNNEKAARINMTQTLIFGVLVTLALTALVTTHSTGTARFLGSSGQAFALRP